MIFQRADFNEKDSILIAETSTLGLLPGFYPEAFQIDGFTYFMEGYEGDEGARYRTRGGRVALLLNNLKEEV